MGNWDFQKRVIQSEVVHNTDPNQNWRQVIILENQTQTTQNFDLQGNLLWDTTEVSAVAYNYVIKRDGSFRKTSFNYCSSSETLISFTAEGSWSFIGSNPNFEKNTRLILNVSEGQWTHERITSDSIYIENEFPVYINGQYPNMDDNFNTEIFLIESITNDHMILQSEFENTPNSGPFTYYGTIRTTLVKK